MLLVALCSAHQLLAEFLVVGILSKPPVIKYTSMSLHAGHQFLFPSVEAALLHNQEADTVDI